MTLGHVSVLGLVLFCTVSAYDGYASILLEIFPEVNGDLTKITWVHRANSQEELNHALKSDKMIIEADVSLGTHIGSQSGILTAIMAHPPNTTSDLTLEQFLKATVPTDKGIKLDFKSRYAFSVAEHIITREIAKREPKVLILNADIVKGPINCQTDPVDGDYFLSRCPLIDPNAIISVGWTTCYGPENSVGQYTSNHIQEMNNLLNRNNIVSEVTFAIRAGLAAQSTNELLYLMRTSVDATLTIWSSNQSDPVNVKALNKLIEEVGKDKVLLDLDEDLYKKVESGTSQAHVIKPLYLLIIFILIGFFVK